MRQNKTVKRRPLLSSEIQTYLEVLCAVCKSSDRVEFLTITDCNLCHKCRGDLSDGFEEAMKMDRSDYPEL